MPNTVLRWLKKHKNISFVSRLAVVLSLGFTVSLGANSDPDKIKKNKVVKLAVQQTERGQKGEWSTAFTNEVIAVHTSVLPNGKVLTWGNTGLNGNYNQTAARIWDPVSGGLQTVNYLDGNIFCSGHSFLPDGRLLAAGGIANGAFAVGINEAALFDYNTNQWSQLPANMNNARWYPTNLTLGNGNTLVWAGTISATQLNSVPQILEKQSDGSFSWRSLRIVNPEITNFYYSWTHLLSSGKVFVIVGYSGKSYVLSVGEKFRFPRDFLYGFPAHPTDPDFDGKLTDPRDSGSSVVYGKDQILVMGGHDFPKYTAEIINMGAASPKWERVGRLKTGRVHFNATLLPDGKVFVNGGNTGPGFNNNCPEYFVKESEMWDPAAPGDPDTEGAWKQLASATQPRLYHSSAVLLPDGRVLTGGTTSEPKQVSKCPQIQDNYIMEIFSPPYLFNTDGTEATRPEITTAPAQASYGQTIGFTVSGAGSGSKVNLIRLPSVTHSFNQNQGFSKLQPTISGQNFSITIPANRNELPPGHYMMFVLNTAGVPSKAKIIQVL